MQFKNLIGQTQAKTILLRTVNLNQLPKSYLFSGPEGVGKWVAALALTAYLNCRNRAVGDSCGECQPCRQIKSLQYPNMFIALPTPPSRSDKEEQANYWDILHLKIDEPYLLIGGKRQMSIPVNTIREMRRSLHQKPAVPGRRVVIIEQMDKMLTASGDALLKLIEEPPPKTLIIITTSRPDRIQATIHSRCREIKYAHLSEQSIVDYLINNKNMSPDKGRLLSRLATGSLGRAIYLSEEDNLQDREIAKLIFQGLFDGDIAEVVVEAADLLPVTDRSRLNRIISHWQSLFRDLIMLHSGDRGERLINFDFTSQLEKLAGRQLPLNRLLEIPRQLGSVKEDIDLNVEPKSAVSGALINIHNLIIPQ